MSTEPNVKSFPITDVNGRTVQITVSTDIVDYMASARSFGREDMAAADAHGRFQKRLIAIPDRKSEVVAPMVLTIGNNNGLYLVRRSAGATGEGWKLIDLGTAFVKAGIASPQVRALGAAWTDDDRIALAVAVDDGRADSPSRVFVAYDLSSATDWANIPWTDCGSREKIRVHGIRVLAEDGGGWTVVLDGDAGRVDMLYLLRSERPAQFAQALVFNPAVDYQEIFAFEAAIDPFIGSGIAVLGKSGNKSVLSFRPFPKYDAQGRASAPPPVVPLPCPEGATVLESGVTRNGGTDLYIGGRGIHLIVADEFDNQDDAKLIQVASADAASGVEELALADAADGGVSVWARKQNGDLVTVTRAAGADVWGTALRVRDGVQSIAPVHGDRHATTSLLVVYTNGQAAFLLRDAALGTWRESPLLVGNPNEAAKVTCYGASVRLVDEGGMPRLNVPVKVSASVLTNLSLNRNNVFIGPGLEFAAKTDANGGIQLYDRVRSLTPAVYRFTVEGLQGSIDVNPAGGIYDRFSALTPDELRNAHTQPPDGTKTPLLPKEFQAGGARSNEVDGMVGALKQTAGLAGKTTNGKVTGATQVRAGAAFSSKLRLDTVAVGYSWGIQADRNGVRPAGEALMESLAGAAQNAAAFFADLGDSIADFFEGVRGRIEEGWTFIVRRAEQAFEFICALGNKVKRFVLDTLEQVGSFFTWLWNEVKTGLEKVWEYLKFLFSWDDILVARDVMVAATDEALKYVKSSVGTLKKNSMAGFNATIAQIDKWRAEIGVPPAHLPPPKPGSSMADQFRESDQKARTAVDQSTGNSALGWVFERLNDLFDQVVHIDAPSPGRATVDAAASFVTGLAGDQLDNLMRTWQQIQADIQQIFSSGMPGAKDLSFETIRQLLVAVGADVVVGLLNALRSLIDRALDLLGQMIDVVRSVLFAKISFPFIEKLVELVAPGAHLDTSFRLVDAIMLLVAIPATITYKLIFNESPFKRGETLDLPFGRVTVQGLEWEDLIKTVTGIVPFIGIGAAFAKFAKGVYTSVKAVAEEFGGTNVGIVAAIAFGGIGLAAEIFGMHQKEGDIVTILEWTAAGASGIALATSMALAIPKWNNPVAETIPMAHKLEAVIEVFETAVQLIVGAVAFGFIVDNLNRSDQAYDKKRYMPETTLWLARLMDQLGDILVSSATLVPLEAALAKAIVILGGAVFKGAAIPCKIMQVASTKLILEAKAPA